MSRATHTELDLTPAEKRALLADLLRQKAARPRQVPVSFAQQRLWLLAQLEPDSSAYNIPRALRIEGDLDTQALRQTLNQIIARHDVLRGNFAMVDGEPVQQIPQSREMDLPLLVLESSVPADTEQQLARLIAMEAQRPFNLVSDLLLRASLIKIGPQDHVLLLTMHHVVSDGWSMGVLVREIATIYQAVVEGQPADLPRLPIQYADFARWQREQLQGENLQSLAGYWREELTGAPSVLDLPVARPRPPMQSVRGAHVTSRIHPEISAALADLSRREGATLFMSLLAAFQTLLHRYSGQKDFVVGSPIAARNRAETEDLIGFFVNSLPLRARLSGNPTFRELLRRVKETALGAYAHQDLPFEKIVEELQPERSLSYAPIFQVMFALQNQPRGAFTLPGLKVTPVERESNTSKFDLTLYVTETDQGLACWLEYNTDLFNRGAMESLLRHYEVLLESIVADPDRRIGELIILDAGERHRLLVEWNQTGAEFADRSLHQLFEAQVEKTPQAPAVVSAEARLTYAELNARANQIARYLRDAGVGPEQRVGICLTRSAEMIAAVLGILKSGAAYVPLDLAYPQERLAFTLRDAAVSALVTESGMRGLFPDLEAPLVCLDADRDKIRRCDPSNLPHLTNGFNLAYVIYTSGSTGHPKGVAVEHRSAAAFVAWVQSVFTPAELSGVLFSTSICFDISAFELFAPLSVGGKMIVAANALDLPRIDLSEVTLINTVPSAMAEMIRMQSMPRSVVTINLCGEPLTGALARDVYRQRSVARVLNLYGPTEDTVYSTFAVIERGDHAEPPIGRPISNTAVYLLDRNLEPVPAGLPGDLYLSGAGLARGYLNRPELTAASFVADPFSAKPGARMYRTGDLARYRSDGTLEYLGRSDHQIKLRGFRIELGEIESVLREHPAVQDAVVVVRQTGAGNRDLVAYVVPRGATAEESLTAGLKQLLQQKLPVYMMPAGFVMLERLPLTPNGKLDRKALPELDRSRPDLVNARIDPRNQTEAELAKIWMQVLDLTELGVTDNFFALGGHSLLAVRLMAEIEQRLGRKIPLVSLFGNATIELQAEILDHNVDTTSWPTLVEIQPGSQVVTPLFCVSMPNVNALGYATLARYLEPERPVYGLQAQYPEDLQGEHSQSAVDALASDYLQAVRAVQPRGPYQFIGMCRGAHIAFEMARRLEQVGERVAFVGILDTWVLENTYNRFLYVGYYARRVRSSLRLGPGEFVSLIKRTLVRKRSPSQPSGSAASGPPPLANPMKAYFPGPDFVPKTFRGSLSVFRARRQPWNRIRDRELGWGKLTEAGVDLHYVPGRHGASVLREPHVKVLARELKECLLR